jgi:hypothetical protein
MNETTRKPGSGQGSPNPNSLKQPSRKREEEKQAERQSGGRKDADDDVVGGADPAETDPERGERTP